MKLTKAQRELLRQLTAESECGNAWTASTNQNIATARALYNRGLIEMVTLVSGETVMRIGSV